jgi:hypothetical protein
MEVDTVDKNVSTLSLSLPLMELLAIRLSWQTTPAKSLVMQGGGDGRRLPCSAVFSFEITICDLKFEVPYRDLKAANSLNE